MPEYKQVVFVRLSVIGMHHWANAPERQAFLRASHRHTFTMEVTVPVPHGDRAVECFDLVDRVTKRLEQFRDRDGIHQFGHMSCENIAQFIADDLESLGACGVSVLEDNMQGGGVWRYA